MMKFSNTPDSSSLMGDDVGKYMLGRPPIQMRTAELVSKCARKYARNPGAPVIPKMPTANAAAAQPTPRTNATFCTFAMTAAGAANFTGSTPLPEDEAAVTALVGAIM
jgi:hypothetical protein